MCFKNITIRTLKEWNYLREQDKIKQAKKDQIEQEKIAQDQIKGKDRMCRDYGLEYAVYDDE